jgi:hypothetical protein
LSVINEIVTNATISDASLTNATITDTTITDASIIDATITDLSATNVIIDNLLNYSIIYGSLLIDPLSFPSLLKINIIDGVNTTNSIEINDGSCTLQNILNVIFYMTISINIYNSEDINGTYIKLYYMLNDIPTEITISRATNNDALSVTTTIKLEPNDKLKIYIDYSNTNLYTLNGNYTITGWKKYTL